MPMRLNGNGAWKWAATLLATLVLGMGGMFFGDMLGQAKSNSVATKLRSDLNGLTVQVSNLREATSLTQQAAKQTAAAVEKLSNEATVLVDRVQRSSEILVIQGERYRLLNEQLLRLEGKVDALEKKVDMLIERTK